MARVENPAQQSVETIQPAPPGPGPSGPCLATGARIVENRAFQGRERIKPRPLQVQTDPDMALKAVFTRFEAAFLAQDIAAIRTCLSPAFQWHLPNGQIVYGREEALAEMECRFAMPGGPKFSGTVWRFLPEGRVLQTYRVEYAGPDGKWRQSRGFDAYETGDGLITLKDAYWKMIP